MSLCFKLLNFLSTPCCLLKSTVVSLVSLTENLSCHKLVSVFTSSSLSMKRPRVPVLSANFKRTLEISFETSFKGLMVCSLCTVGWDVGEPHCKLIELTWTSVRCSHFMVRWQQVSTQAYIQVTVISTPKPLLSSTLCICSLVLHN